MKATRHIPFEKLADVAEGRLAGSERDSSVDLLPANIGYAEAFERLGHVLQLMRADDSKDAPRGLLAYAKSLVSVRSKDAEPYLLKRIVASLTFDSLTTAPEFGVRSTESSTRQLIFTAED